MNLSIDEFSPPLSQLNVDERLTKLRELIKVAHNDQEEARAALKLSELLQEFIDGDGELLALSGPVLGPLCHALSKLMQSHDRTVVKYAARSIKPMIRDDSLRGPACASGLARAISARGTDAEVIRDPDVLREMLAVAQNVLWDASTAPDFCQSGGLRFIAAIVTELSQASDVEKGASRSAADPECRLMAFACAANALALCDTALSGHTHELRAWIDPLVRLLQRGRDQNEAEYLAASLANATRDPGLAHALRAVNGAEALERSRHGDPKVAAAASVALARLNFASGAAEEDPFRYRWGGKSKGHNAISSQQVMALLAFLLLATVCAGAVILILLSIHHSFGF